MSKDWLEQTLMKLQKENPGLTFSIKEANTTNSFYVRFFYGDRKRTVRISDHNSGKNMPSNIFAGAKRTNNVGRFLSNNVKTLKTLVLGDLLKGVSKNVNSSRER